MTFELVVLTLAAAQAFLLSLLIFQKHRAVYANRFLSLMMLICGVGILHILVQDYGFYKDRRFLLYAILGFPFLVAPLHFLYLKYLVSQNGKFVRRDWIHVFPALFVEAAVFILAMIFPAEFVDTASRNVALASLPYRLYNWLLAIHGITYTLVSASVLLRYRGTMKDVASSLENVRLGWLMYLTLAALATWMIFLTEVTLLALGINLSNYIVTSICAAIYVYTIGYFGLLKSEVFAAPAVGETMHEIFQTASDESKATGKYEKSGLDEATARSLLARLQKLMDDGKPYTNASLTLARLAAMMSITPHNLSEVINTQCGSNFYDFINGFRVAQVKRDLSDPSKQNLKILAIAFEAGFNSKASFNEVFKSLTHLTPSQFRRQAAKDGPED